MDSMSYKSYQAEFEFDDVHQRYVGRLLGVSQQVDFYASSKEQLQLMFHQAVDDHLLLSEQLKSIRSHRLN